MFHKMFYTCEQASELSIKNEEGKASLGERLRLWVHIQVCGFCKTFAIQNQKLTSYVDEWKGKREMHASKEAKDRWRSELSSAQKE